MSKQVGCEHCQRLGEKNSLKEEVNGVICCHYCHVDLKIPRWYAYSVESTLMELINKLQEKGIILPSELTTLAHNEFVD